MTDRSSGGGRIGGFLVALVVLGAAAGAGWWFFLRDDDAPEQKEATGPKSVAESYYDRIDKADCTFTELMTESYAKSSRANTCERNPDRIFERADPGGAVGTFDVGEPEVDDSRAQVRVRYLVDGEALASGTTTLVKRGEEWKVDKEAWVER